MNHFPDDVVSAFTPVQRKQKRLGELQYWIGTYVASVNATGLETLRIRHESVSYLNTHYWECLESQIRRRMLPHAGNDERLVDRHKIASTTELMTMAAMPIESEGGDDETQLLTNAKLGYALGLMIIGNFDNNVITSLAVSRSFVEQHLVWLCEVRATPQFQFFSNAATWYLVELLFKERQQASKA